jgi:hypothetical protein
VTLQIFFCLVNSLVDVLCNLYEGRCGVSIYLSRPYSEQNRFMSTTSYMKRNQVSNPDEDGCFLCPETFSMNGKRKFQKDFFCAIFLCQNFFFLAQHVHPKCMPTKMLIPGLEPGFLDSKSRVITTTLYEHVYLAAHF